MLLCFSMIFVPIFTGLLLGIIVDGIKNKFNDDGNSFDEYKFHHDYKYQNFCDEMTKKDINIKGDRNHAKN